MGKKSADQAKDWMHSRGWKPQHFQSETWSALSKGEHGLVNAPTGSGKTYSLLLPALFDAAANPKSGVRIMWITPIRALAKEIESAAKRVIESSDLNLEIGIRTGDTSQKERNNQRKRMPEVLITTPESLHLMLASKEGSKNLKHLQLIVADEWHELMGTKRGVLWELALSRIVSIAQNCLVWGISATIGNLEEAMKVLLGAGRADSGVFVRADIVKKIEVVSILPQEEDRLPWAGHLGTKLVDHVSSIVDASESTLIFTNTRAQCEVWYRTILEANMELAGLVAMHHGSISKDLRHWVEEAIADGRLRAVVCTSSLDLGVDFAPVDSIIQIGGPKGVARFLQRAGRSGHRPEALSKIFFLPTNALELIEAAALRQAVADSFLEEKEPMLRSFDVLVQYLITLSLGEGVELEQTYAEVSQTYCFQSMTREEWEWIIAFVKSGGQALQAYPDYQRWVERDGKWFIANQRMARRHRMSIGTIVSDTMMSVKFKRGGLIGHIEESFIAGLNEGDAFWFAGMGLKLIQVKELTAYVAKSDSMNGKIPSWQGGRLPLSSKMSVMLRRKITEAMQGNPAKDPELDAIQQLLSIQNDRSLVPNENQLLIESFQSEDGFHAVFYPFEGRFVHEGLASLFAYRMGKMYPLSFSLAYNDYGFELLSDQPIPLEEALGSGLTDALALEKDLLSGINATELAKRRFRDIATISGLIFKGYPGEPVRDRHLQSSSQLIFKVFEEYDPQNLLLKQAYDEVIYYQLEINRMRSALDRMNRQEIMLNYPEKPTPFAFPIMVDRLRERMTTESLGDRIAKMTLDLSE
ncbi:MAG: ligase-associated DNA damage response DEXH box helicase [Flavobacteriales bacterium]